MERKNMLFKSTTAALVLILAASCSFFQMPPAGNQKGSLTITAQVNPQAGWGMSYAAPGGGRTLTLDSMALANMANRLKLTFQPQPSGSSFEVNLADGSFSKNSMDISITSLPDIPTGTYHLTVDAFNAAGQVYLTGTTTTTFLVTVGTNTVNGLVLKPLMSASGTGSTFLKINYPSNTVIQILGAPQVFLKKLAWPSGGGTEPSTLTDIATLGAWTSTDNFGDGDSFTGDLELEALSLSSGQYEVRIKFQNFPIPFVETLHIFDNVHTGAFWDFYPVSFGETPLQPQMPDMGPMAEKIPGDGSTTKNRVVLRWKDASTNEVGFVIYRRIGSDPTRQLVFQTGPNVETWTDDNAGAGLAADTDYHYEIFSATFAGTSSTGLFPPVMNISSTGQLEMFLADRDQDLLSNNSVDINGLYGRAPYLLPGIGGGTVIPVVMKNSGLSNLNISSFGFTAGGAAMSAVTWQVQNSAKTSMGQPTDFSILPGDFVVFLVMAFPINGSHALEDPFSGTLSLNDGTSRTFTFSNGYVRDNILYVDNASGIDTNSGASASPLNTLGRALMIAQDGDTIRLASSAQVYDTVYSGKDYSIIKKRIRIEGDLLTGSWAPDGTQEINSVIVNTNSGGPKPALAFVDTPIHGTWQAGLSKVFLKGTAGADSTLKLINARANFTDIRITPPEATALGNSVGLRVEGGPAGASAGDVNLFSNVVVAFEGLASTPASRSYAILNGNYNLKFVNSRFETLDGLIPQYHYGIEVQPLGAAELGDLVFQDSAVEVGLSNPTGFSRGVTVYRGSLTKKLAFHRTKFRFIGSNKSGETNPSNADVALYLTQGAAGDYKPLVESSRFYFNRPQPMVGIQIASSAVRALVFQNLFGEVGNTTSSLGYKGIIDGGTETLIYNNTFSTDYSQTSGAEAKWIAIENTTSRPRIVNNLFGGLRNFGASFAGIGVHQTGDVNTGAQNPLEFRNNGFIGVTMRFWHRALAARNTEAELNDTGVNQLSPSSGGNRVLGTGTYLYQTPTPVDFALPSNAYDGITNLETNPVVMFGGTNLTQAILAWGGPSPNWTDVALMTVDSRRFHDYSYTTPGIWSLGADEPPPQASTPLVSWSLTSVSNGNTDPANFFTETTPFRAQPGAQGFTLALASRNDRSGTPGQASFFNGRTNYILAGQSQSTLDTSTGWAVGAWFGDVSYKSHPGADPLQTIAAASDLAGNMVWRLAIKGNTRELMVEVAGQPPVKAPLPSFAQYKKWNHVFAVFDRVNSRIVLYLNGDPVPFAQAAVPVDSLVFDLTPTTGHVVALGNRQGNGIPMDEYFYGQLDDVGLFNHALDPQEVAQFQSTNAAALGGTVPGSVDSTLSFEEDIIDPRTGTGGTISAVSVVADAHRYIASWSFNTGAGIIQGDFWSPGNAPLIPAWSMPVTSNFDYKVRGWNMISGILGGTTQNGAKTYSYQAGTPAWSLRGLWTFGGAAGRNLVVPDGTSGNLNHSSGAGWNNWWDPARAVDGSTIDEMWNNNAREVGAVWLDGSSHLWTDLADGSPLNLNTSNTEFTLVVRFRYSGLLPSSPNIFPLVSWTNGTGDTKVMSVGIYSVSGDHWLKIDGPGMTTPADFPIAPIASPFLLSDTRTYTLALGFTKGAGQVLTVFLDNGTSPEYFVVPFEIGSIPGGSSKFLVGQDQLTTPQRYTGWIEEVRVYSGLTDIGNFPGLGHGFYDGIREEYFGPKTGTTYTLGTTGPSGGTIVYDKGNWDGGWRYLEAAPTDEGAYPMVSAGTNDLFAPSGYGTGRDNTLMILQQRVKEGASGTAAQVAAQFELNGNRDWYLPSHQEMVAVDAYFTLMPGVQYWTSSDNNDVDNNGEGYNSDSGTKDAVSLTNAGYVRPVRRF